MEQFNGFCDVYDNGKILSCMRLEYVDKTVDLLNEQHETITEQASQIDFLKDENKHMRNVLNENKQLKQRNDRQAKQLDHLYNLIEEKDWRTLSDIIDDFKRCEEQLQREWKCYE